MTQKIDWTGQVLRMRVDGPAQGGEFVARHEGRVVFCRGGISGELVDVLVEDDPGRAFCRGTVHDVVEASPERVTPRCPAAAAGAGCCDWSHISSEAAVEFSGQILAEQAQRIGRIQLPEESVPVRAPGGDDALTGWRTVARWVTGADGVPGVRRAKSRELITIACTQADPRLREAVEVADVGPFREVIGVLGDDGTVHVAHRPSTDPPRRNGRRGSRQAAVRARSRHSRAGKWELVIGPSTVSRRVGDRAWDLPIGGFWQAHRSAAAHYAAYVGAAVVETVNLPADPVVWDLYGGAGLFAAATLDRVPGAQVTLVESAADSLGAARAGFGPEIHTVRSRVETFLGESTTASSGEGSDAGPDAGSVTAVAPDVVILDPPRGGAGIDVMTRLADLTSSRIIHVGCDPASLARDIGVLVAAGWQLVELSGVAAFPGTHHVEGVAVLDPPPTGRTAVAHAVD